MRIGITDSGVGGLSVCAAVEAKLRAMPLHEDVEIFYLNAAIEDHYSYNSMPDRQTKLQAFDRFLHSVQEKYSPDLLFIACNTLSVLYQDPYFDHHRHKAIEGIVDTGTKNMLEAFRRQPSMSLLVFATPTTIEEGVYGQRLVQLGIPAQQIVQQACPGLPDAISNDASGQLAAELLKVFVATAIDQLEQGAEHVLAFLGCTHYGYQADEFEKALSPLVENLHMVNPNEGAADTIISNIQIKSRSGHLKIEFVSRYVIPQLVIESLSTYIGKKSPATLSALKNFTHLPGLCGEL